MNMPNREAAPRQDVAPDRIIRALESVIPGDRILPASADGARLSVAPRDVNELAEVLRLASGERWRVIPCGAGTWLEMGNRPVEAHLHVSTAQMNRVIEYEPADLTATVEAGCTLADFNSVALKHRQLIPLDPFGDERMTLGAIAATASAGPLRAGFGTPRDWIIGLRVVHADGRVTKAGGKVVKNVAGYDLCKLYTGSFGTLGVIAELSFKLRARPSEDLTVLCEGDDASTLSAVVARILDSDLQPAAVEMFSPRAIGLEHISDARCVLALRFRAEPEAVKSQLADLASIAGAARLRELDDDEAMEMHRLYRANETAMHWGYILRSCVLPANLAAMLADLERILPGAGAVCAHAANGIIRVFADAAWLDGLKTAQRPRRLAELRAAAQSRGGQMAIIRAPDEIRAHLDVWGEVGAAARWMREIKEKFDPQAILNPGRFVAGI
jgi:glycolate oxidase FAD binding subunit